MLENGMKVGMTGVGSFRLLHYNAYFIERDLDLPDIFSMIDVGNLPADVQTTLVEMMLAKVKQFAPAKLPTKIGEAVDMDAKGLPIFTQYFLYTLVNSLDECTVFGGGIEMKSFLCFDGD